MRMGGGKLGDFLTEGFCKLVGRGVAPVDNGTDGVVWFVYFDQALYGRCGGI